MEDCLHKMDDGFSTLSMQLKNIAEGLEEQKRRVQLVEEQEQQVSENLSVLKKQQHVTRNISEQAVGAAQELKENLEAFKTTQKSTLETLSTTQKAVSTRVRTVEDVQIRMKGDIRRVTARIEATTVTPEIHSNIYFPERSEWFTGRTHELQQMHGFPNESVEASRTLVLYGLGGSGKTSLAIEHAYQRQSFYPGGVLWVSADSEAAFEDSIAGIARDFGVVDVDFKTTYHRLLKWLQGIKQRWLMVVDNVDQEDIPSHLASLLSGSWKDHACGHVIVTSRRSYTEIGELFGKPNMETLEVGCFSEEDALEFLQKRTKRPNHPAMTDLLEELGFLPLAVEQAAAYLVSVKQCTIPEYVEAFKTLRLKHISKKRARAAATAHSKERLAVHTTYRMNFDCVSHDSEEMGLGPTATIVMKVAAYLSPDDIPVEVINLGCPQVDNELAEALNMPTTRAEVLAILTRFSLFHMNQDRTVSVHRLVQEVMRYDDTPSEKQFYMQCGMRMLNQALRNTVCPNDIIEGQVDSGDLNLWGKLARNACSLRDHLLQQITSGVDEDFIRNLEFANLCYQASIFLSISQRQAEAFTAQIEKNTIMISLTRIDKPNTDYLHLIKIPILEKDRKMLQAKMSAALEETSEVASESEKVAELQENLAVIATKECHFPDAIRHLSCAIMAAKNNEVQAKLFSARSQCYLNVGDFENALSDAEKCIEIEPMSWEGHFQRAHALANLHDEMGASFCYCAGLVSASVAAHIHPPCNLLHNIKVLYPIVVYQLIQNSEDLTKSISSLEAWKHTTLIMKRGHYSIGLVPAKSLHLVGIEDGVFVSVGNLQGYPKENLTMHFENITFPETCAELTIPNTITASFYRCNFSNGLKACEDFPKCQGGKGCRGKAPMSCLEYAKLKAPANFTEHICVGFAGFAAIFVQAGARAEIVRCRINGAGGAGLAVSGEGSSARIIDSVISKCRTNGLDVRSGGKLEAISNFIENNRLHGVCVGGDMADESEEKVSCLLKENDIRSNHLEGVFVQRQCDDTVSLCVQGNIISHNGKSGVALETGSITLVANRIFENWAWGTMAHGVKSLLISDNELYQNKCGAIRLGMACNSSVFIDRNTIRDHTGPAIFDEEFRGYIKGRELCLPEENSRPSVPVVTDNNLLRNNDMGFQHPSEVYHQKVGNQCSQCGCSGPDLKRCSRCKHAMYCSRACQKKHWLIHGPMCKMLQEEYSVVLDLAKDTVRWKGQVIIRTFHPNLKGIQQGPKPDRQSSNRFIVKIQNVGEYSSEDPKGMLTLYDQSTDVDIHFHNTSLYSILMECGILGQNKITGKKIYCWANFEQNGRKLRIMTDSLAPVQTW